MCACVVWVCGVCVGVWVCGWAGVGVSMYVQVYMSNTVFLHVFWKKRKQCIHSATPSFPSSPSMQEVMQSC